MEVIGLRSLETDQVYIPAEGDWGYSQDGLGTTKLYLYYHGEWLCCETHYNDEYEGD